MASDRVGARPRRCGQPIALGPARCGDGLARGGVRRCRDAVARVRRRRPSSPRGSRPAFRCGGRGCCAPVGEARRRWCRSRRSGRGCRPSRVGKLRDGAVEVGAERVVRRRERAVEPHRHVAFGERAEAGSEIAHDVCEFPVRTAPLLAFAPLGLGGGALGRLGFGLTQDDFLLRGGGTGTRVLCGSRAPPPQSPARRARHGGRPRRSARFLRQPLFPRRGPLAAGGGGRGRRRRARPSLPQRPRRGRACGPRSPTGRLLG